jgi:hypothetical protein
MSFELAVISRYVIRYRCAGFAKISVSIIRHPFCFQTSKKTFHQAVDAPSNSPGDPGFALSDISTVTS